MLSRELILELTYRTPLITLLLSSLGLIALKRISALPLWAERLAGPSFYFVSLPIATLIVGMEMFLWMVHVVKEIDQLSASYGLLDHFLFILGIPWGRFARHREMRPSMSIDDNTPVERI